MKFLLLLWSLLPLQAISADTTILPNPNLTPGQAYTTNAEIACKARTGSEPDSIRHVSARIKRKIFTMYGMPGGNHTGYCSLKGCEADHLISLKLGGTNNKENIWPQSYSGKWNAIDKDALEKRLISRVCRTSKKHPVKLSLKVAQDAISRNWINAYVKYVTNNQ